MKELPVKALQTLKEMQNNLKKREKLELEFVAAGAELSFLYGLEPEEIVYWLQNGKSDY